MELSWCICSLRLGELLHFCKFLEFKEDETNERVYKFQNGLNSSAKFLSQQQSPAHRTTGGHFSNQKISAHANQIKRGNDEQGQEREETV